MSKGQETRRRVQLAPHPLVLPRKKRRRLALEQSRAAAALTEIQAQAFLAAETGWRERGTRRGGTAGTVAAVAAAAAEIEVAHLGVIRSRVRAIGKGTGGAAIEIGIGTWGETEIRTGIETGAKVWDGAGAGVESGG